MSKGTADDAPAGPSDSPPAAATTVPTVTTATATAAAANQGGDNAAAAADRGKKPAWEVPSSNGSIEVGSALGSSSWPSLSDSTKSSSSTESLTGLALGSVGSPSGPAPLNPNSSEYRGTPFRPKSAQGAADFSGGGFVPNSEYMRTPAALGELMMGGHGFPGASSRGLPNISTNNLDHRGRGNPQPHGGTHHRPRGYAGNNNRRNGGDNRWSHGVGGPQNNYGNLRDLGYGWSNYVTPSSSMPYYMQPPYMQPPPQQMLQQGGMWPFMRSNIPVMPHQYMPPPPGVPPFLVPDVGPPPPLYYPRAPPPPPFVANPAPPAMVTSPVDEKRIALLKQIDYYFSSTNLIKDTYLKNKMDPEGWVDISVIADFPRVQAMNHDIPYILETLFHFSVVVEVQGDRIRKRNDWMEWLPTRYKYTSNSSAPSSSARPSADNLAVRLQAIGLEGTSNRNITLEISESGHSSSQHQNVGKPNGDGEGQHVDQGNDEKKN